MKPMKMDKEDKMEFKKTGKKPSAKEEKAENKGSGKKMPAMPMKKKC